MTHCCDENTATY